LEQQSYRIWVIPEGAVSDDVRSPFFKHMSVDQKVTRVLKLLNEKVHIFVLEDVLCGVVESLGKTPVISGSVGKMRLPERNAVAFDSAS
jgi:hypothetical protein